MNGKKATLRKFFKEKAAMIKNKDERSEKIAIRLFELTEYKNCNCIFAYYSLASEVSTRAIITQSKNCGKKTALPRCAEFGNEMSFYFTEDENALFEGRFKGIYEPPDDFQKAQSDESTLLLVPALAYGRNGSRLGKGMGFYDRFLSSFAGKSVGLCFEDCLENALPETAFDKRVQIIITENETLYIK